ncbi:MAG: hypothetical protein UX17_C0014G0004 [Parcubacteria group bacterium GW2011_GWC2_45_7]|nr:MAG: hypothetical protein UX17_C0014G0004 [Parcubacteria group bacterium GW2011_GWC2_45_7]KKU74038.1 MAG: hypothetical protein UX98_C0002G0068 [Parcubacteria group bacterium GW2011_GWA2_47_26]
MRKRASLEQIFGSRVRVRLLKLFLEHPDDRFYVREITRLTRSHIHSVRRELANLSKVGLVRIYIDKNANGGITYKNSANNLQRKYYEVNPECVIFNELRLLLIKGQLLLQEELARQLSAAGAVNYLALTGFFADLQGLPTDLLLIGRVSKKKCAKSIEDFEEEFGRTINYTILTLKEFLERKEMTDRFLYTLLESKKIVLVDKLPVSSRIG